MMRDWVALTSGARGVVDEQMRHEGRDGAGLRSAQRDVIHAVLESLASRPGVLVAEKTGMGKSLIATALAAALGKSCGGNGQVPFRVALVAPNQQVRTNWTETLLPSALQVHTKTTYLWRAPTEAPTFCIDSPGATIELYTQHFGRGLTNAYSEWSKRKRDTLAHVRRSLFAGHPIRPIDLLIIDEAHQLKDAQTLKGRALATIFHSLTATDEPDEELGEQADEPAQASPVAVGRVLLLTATPFQLDAAAELHRLVKIMSWPTAHGQPKFDPTQVSRFGIRRHLDRFENALRHWISARARHADDTDALAEARHAKHAVEQILRPLIVRSDAPVANVRVSYGRPRPDLASNKPTADSGLSCEDPVERLLFLAWDGAIASRVTFVAAEQQTLTSSAEALRRREDPAPPDGAAFGRQPLAPKAVQEGFFNLAQGLANLVDPDHIKVVATANAVAHRVAGSKPGSRPTLVFAERTGTVGQLEALIAREVGKKRVKSVHGASSPDDRAAHIKSFNEESSELDVLIASRVAEMGLDVDGPATKDDIWLVHHDFPWNPAAVDQRNGRVYRPAKSTSGAVEILYPFLRDTVDERIFKRMLARQALSEVLLGTADVSRALGLASHDALAKLDMAAIAPDQLRKLCPDLAPRPASAEAPVSAQTTADAVDANERAEAEPVSVQGPGASDPDLHWPDLLLDLCGSRATESLGERPISETLRVTATELSLPWAVHADRIFTTKVDLHGRSQCVGLHLRRGSTGVLMVEALSVADRGLDDDKLMEVLRWNARPGIAGLVLFASADASPVLAARAANPLETLDAAELHALIVDTARRGDEWERKFSEVDQW